MCRRKFFKSSPLWRFTCDQVRGRRNWFDNVNFSRAEVPRWTVDTSAESCSTPRQSRERHLSVLDACFVTNTPSHSIERMNVEIWSSSQVLVLFDSPSENHFRVKYNIYKVTYACLIFRRNSLNKNINEENLVSSLAIILFIIFSSTH